MSEKLKSEIVRLQTLVDNLRGTLEKISQWPNGGYLYGQDKN